MKTKLPTRIAKFTRLILYGIFIQVFTISGLVAFNSDIQSIESVKDKKIDLNLVNVNLLQALAELEKNTGYEFVYDRKILKPEIEVDLVGENITVYDYLIILSKEAKLHFKQYNNSISISQRKNDVSEPSVTIIIDTVKVTGRVISNDSGEGIPGVNILIKGTTIGTISDLEGDYSIETPDGESILVFSSVGFISQEVRVGTQNSINIALLTDIQSLEELVIIGYGTAKKSDLTGSISQVTAEDFEDQPIFRLEQVLQGRASGVTVQQNSGQPGGEVRVRIRGANSITGNNDPLIVVDNVIGGDLSSLNPDDIASIEILKDASATAVYGSRGSNGVILVSTKKGSGKPSVNVNYFTSISSLPNKLDLLSAGDFARVQNTKTPGLYSDADISALDAGGGTDWQDEIYQTGATHNFQVSANGKEGKVGYFLSAGYINQEGIMITTGYERWNARSNINVDFSDKFKLGLNLYASREQSDNNQEANGSSNSALVTGTVSWDPTTPVRDENGDYNILSLNTIGSLTVNPVAHLEQLESSLLEDRLDLNLNLSYDILDDLNYTAVIGMSAKNTTREIYAGLPNGINILRPSASYLGINSTGYQVSNILNWTKSFSNHNFNVTGLYEVQNSKERLNIFGARNFSIPAGYYLLELSETQTTTADYIESTIESFMGRVTYDFDGRLFVTGTIRRDKSSRFRPENNTGTFPSVALAYSLQNWSLIESSSFLSNFKIRAGWGEVGNQNVPVYSTWPTISTGRPYPFNGASNSTGTQPGEFGNEDLKWETTTQTNIGLDFSFFDYRLNLSVDAYKKNTTDLLLNTPVPIFAGGGFIQRNVGEVENKGVDIELYGTVIDKNDFNWDANFNLSTYNNEVIDLTEGVDFIAGNFHNPDGGSDAMNRVIKGESLGTFWGKTFLGTWKSSEAAEAAAVGNVPGDAKYLRDADGKIINGIIGNGMPTMSWGFNNILNYKNWNLNLFIRGVHGNEILNGVQGLIVGGTGNVLSTTDPDALNAWTPDNETDIPIASSTNFTASTRYVENGSFVRLSNVSLGYTFDIAGFASANVYVSGQNLLTSTDFSGYDPEVSSRSNSGTPDQAIGINVGAYPNPRVVTVGIKLGF